MWGGFWVIALLLLPGFSEGLGGGESFGCSDVFHVEDPGYYDLMKSSKGMRTCSLLGVGGLWMNGKMDGMG